MSNTNETNYYGVDVYGSGDYGGENIGEETLNGHAGKQLHQQWATCDLCGFEYPFSQLVRQTGDAGGRVVCIVHCLDETSRGDYLMQQERPVEQPLVFIPDGS